MTIQPLTELWVWVGIAPTGDEVFLKARVDDVGWAELWGRTREDAERLRTWAEDALRDQRFGNVPLARIELRTFRMVTTP